MVCVSTTIVIICLTDEGRLMEEEIERQLPRRWSRGQDCLCDGMFYGLIAVGVGVGVGVGCFACV